MAKATTADIEKRTYTIPLRKSYSTTPKYRRTGKAVSAVKQFLQRHMKSKTVKLGKHLNAELWAKGIKNPPPRVKVTVFKKDDVVKAELFGHDYVDFKKQEKKKDETLKEKLMSKVSSDDKKEEAKAEEK